MRFCHLFHAGPGAAPSFRAGQTLAWRKHTLGALPSGFLAVLTEGTRGGSPPLLSQRQPHLSGPPPPSPSHSFASHLCTLSRSGLLPTPPPALSGAVKAQRPHPTPGLAGNRDHSACPSTSRPSRNPSLHISILSLYVLAHQDLEPPSGQAGCPSLGHTVPGDPACAEARGWRGCHIREPGRGCLQRMGAVSLTNAGVLSPQLRDL